MRHAHDTTEVPAAGRERWCARIQMTHDHELDGDLIHDLSMCPADDASPRERTAARLAAITARKRVNRRERGPTDGGRALRFQRQEALFPGFPKLGTSYVRAARQGGSLTQLQAAIVRDLMYAFAAQAEKELAP